MHARMQALGKENSDVSFSVYNEEAGRKGGAGWKGRNYKEESKKKIERKMEEEH